MEFKQPIRRREGYGLTHESEGGQYQVYESDQVGGLPVEPPRFVPIALDGAGRQHKIHDAVRSLRRAIELVEQHWRGKAAKRAAEGDAAPRKRRVVR
jgi:hypothetical protein